METPTVKMKVMRAATAIGGNIRVSLIVYMLE
jgi:hypothetical protein